jgi:hypothetical protein
MRLLPTTAPPSIERTIERWLVYSEDEVYGWDHRVDRVLGFFSSRPNCDPPTLSPPSETVVLPFGSGKGNALAFGRGGGGSQCGRGDRHCGTLGIYVLCVVYVPLRWSLMCSRVAAMSISLDPLVMRFRTMSMSMYVPDRPTPSLRYTKLRYFYTASSNFCEKNLVFCEHFIAEKLSKLDASFWLKYSFLIMFLQRFLRNRRLLLQFSLFLGKLTLYSHFKWIFKKGDENPLFFLDRENTFSPK